MKQNIVNKVNFLVYFAWKYNISPQFRLLKKLKIANSRETIQTIIDNRMSIARFGDGELSLMSGEDTGFQRSNCEIIEKLHKIIKNETEGLLVGLPHVWKHLWLLKYRAVEFWGAYLAKNLSAKIIPIVNFETRYYDASFTRFYIDYRSDRNANIIVPLIKKIWNERNVCIVEGVYSRLGVGNDLFDNVGSLHRILCPAQNAFSEYDRIIMEVSKLSKDTLILIALGMTATCLAYDLHLQGYQAVDIGHVDVEYEWFKMKAKNKVAIPGKFVAESINNMPQRKLEDEKYESQIIAKVGV